MSKDQKGKLKSPDSIPYTYERDAYTDQLNKIELEPTTTPQQDRKWAELMDEIAIELEHEFKSKK